MRSKLIIPHKPFSVNSMTYRDKRHKTPEFSNWCRLIQEHLRSDKNQEVLKNLREHFKPESHAFSVDLTFYYPHEILFTRKNMVSAKAHDLSNIEKPLIDIVFLPQFHKSCNNLNIDDKYILNLTSKKRTLEEHLIEVWIEIIDTSSFFGAP